MDRVTRLDPILCPVGATGSRRGTNSTLTGCKQRSPGAAVARCSSAIRPRASSNHCPESSRRLMNRQQQSPPATYQGRPLVRPDDEIVDQGLGFDVDTLMGRCRMLRTLGLGVAAIGLAACGSNAVSGPTSSVADTSGSGTSGANSSGAASASGSTAASLAEIPDETAGHYPGDGLSRPATPSRSPSGW